MGVLRARAQWLARREEARALATPRDQTYCTRNVETLFGTTARKACLRLRSLETVREGQAMRAASVKLDRFAHGPMDSALFDVEAFADCAFTAVLELVESPQPDRGDEECRACDDGRRKVVPRGIQ